MSFSRKLNLCFCAEHLDSVIGAGLCKGERDARGEPHICLEASGTSHPEQWNSKLIELRRHAAPVKGAFVTALQTGDDIVIREETCEHSLGPQSTYRACKRWLTSQAESSGRRRRRRRRRGRARAAGLRQSLWINTVCCGRLLVMDQSGVKYWVFKTFKSGLFFYSRMKDIDLTSSSMISYGSQQAFYEDRWHSPILLSLYR